MIVSDEAARDKAWAEWVRDSRIAGLLMENEHAAFNAGWDAALAVAEDGEWAGYVRRNDAIATTQADASAGGEGK